MHEVVAVHLAQPPRCVPRNRQRAPDGQGAMRVEQVAHVAPGTYSCTRYGVSSATANL